jgi:hypothetical protein
MLKRYTVLSAAIVVRCRPTVKAVWSVLLPRNLLLTRVPVKQEPVHHDEIADREHDSERPPRAGQG